MRRKALSLLFAFSLIRILASTCVAQEKPSPGFTLETISEWHGDFTPGFHAVIVRETNTSNSEIRESSCATVNGRFKLSVTYEGLPVQEKETVQQHRKRGELNRCYEGRMPLRIKPGAHADHIVHVYEFYDMSRPGEYVVTVSKETDPDHPDKNVTVISNPLTIVVTESEAKAVEEFFAAKRALGPLTIEAEEPVVQAGEPVIVDITRKNMTGETVTLRNHSDAIRWYDFEVRRGSEPVPETEDLRLAKAPGTAFIETREVVTLEPEEITKTGIDLTRFYDMSKPGKYRITAALVCVRCAQDEIVKSNTITITVLPADATPPAKN